MLEKHLKCQCININDEDEIEEKTEPLKSKSSRFWRINFYKHYEGWRCFEGFRWYIQIHKWICQTFTQFDVHWCFVTSTITFIINVSATVEIRNCQGTTSLDIHFSEGKEWHRCRLYRFLFVCFIYPPYVLNCIS